MLPWRQKLPISCIVLDHKVLWAPLGFCIGGQIPGTRMVIGAKLQTKFYLNCIHSCCRDGHMPTVILCTMLPSIQTMVQKLRISSSSTTSFLATNRGQLSLQSQLYLLKTTCQRPIKSTCSKTINKHLRTEPTMALCLITSRTDPETSFCIVLTGWQEATSSQPVTLLTMIRRREYLKLWNHLVLNTESALATTTQILCPHAHVKTGHTV